MKFYKGFANWIYMSKNFQYKNVSPRMAAAIKLSIAIGFRLQSDLPQIANDYRNLMSRLEIIGKYDICNMYSINASIAKPSVTYAIRGYHGDEKVGKHTIYSYDGLISDKNELNRIIVESRKKRLEMMVEEMKGIHSQTKEERKRRSSKGGINSAISHGFIPWSDNELKEGYRCSLLKEYQSKKRYGLYFRVDNFLIAERLNMLYHNKKNIRNKRSVRFKLCKYRAKLKED